MRSTDSFPHGDFGDWSECLSNDHFCGSVEHGPRHKPPSMKDFESHRIEVGVQLDYDSSRSPVTPDASAPIELLDDALYVELHLHSNYSLLEGASTIEELVWTASEQGHRALALSDHNGMYGSMEFARAAKEVGLRPITALELTITGTGDEPSRSSESQIGRAHV